MSIKIVLGDNNSEVDYTIAPFEHELAHDWLTALDHILEQQLHLNKTFCWLGFPNNPRSLEYLCDKLNSVVFKINTHNWKLYGLEDYYIEEWFSPDVVRYGLEYQLPHNFKYEDYNNVLTYQVKHDVMNRLHNHFERLQGTVENPSEYFIRAPHMKHVIGQLNTICHEIEQMILGQRQALLIPEWLHPSQITSFSKATRHTLKPVHRELFRSNHYDRKFAHVYMHWAQIGKTLFEVWRDEHAPVLDVTTCEAITHLQYYSGEFDVEWGRDVVRGKFEWYDQQMEDFEHWLVANNFDPTDTSLSLGYLPLGNIDTQASFGTSQTDKIWNILSNHLNIKRIETDKHSVEYPYTWRDEDA
jgi:hypothetical protein